MAVDWREENATYRIEISGLDDPTLLNEVSMTEVTMTESLLLPSVDTAIKLQAPIHNPIAENYPKFKNWDDFKGKEISFSYANPNIPGSEHNAIQTIYRLENREVLNRDVETFTLRACDYTTIQNQKSRISKQYSCENPSTVVNDALRCLGANSTRVDESTPKRRYIANNIHPFQVIYEQAEVALTNNHDPSFVHFMSYENGGTHNFRSLETMSKTDVKWFFVRNDPGFGNFTGNPVNIMAWKFPCDFDLLTDIMNGINENGDLIASIITNNGFNASTSLVGGSFNGCSGMGEAIHDEVISDANTDNDCGVQIEGFHMKRKARMSLIQQDKIAIKLYVPFNPTLYCGDVVNVKFPILGTFDEYDYGSGDYMIVNLRHILRSGAHGMTIIEGVYSNSI